MARDHPKEFYLLFSRLAIIIKLFHASGRLASVAALSTTSPGASNLQSLVQKRSLTSQISARPYFPIFYNDVYEVKLPANHRFPMEKYRKVRLMVQERISSLSQEHQHAVECDFRVSPLATFDELTLTHDVNYVRRFLNGDMTEAEIRNAGLPWSLAGVDRALSSTGGTLAAAVAAVEEWQPQEKVLQPHSDAEPTLPRRLCWSAHIAGGTHHAFADHGEGFCIFSDIAVATNVVLQRFPSIVKNILILDLDVHQGNGNAVLFQGRPEVFTFSLHCGANYFSAKQESDLDIELPAGSTDETYLMTLHHWLRRIKEESTGKFDLIFFQAGVDVLEEDRLGRLALTQKGVQRRNDLVFQFAQDLNIPLVITMGGGYPRSNDWTPILHAHANVYLQAHQFLGRY